MACIYKITNKLNNRFYIGFTTKSAEERFKQHIENRTCKRNNNCLLTKAINKYGKEAFIVETLIEGNYTKKELIDLEIKYIKENKAYVKENQGGYNLTTGGEGGLNKVISSETREKLSKYFMGHSFNKGIPKTEEHKKKLAKCMKDMYANGYRVGQSKYCTILDENNNLIGKYGTIGKAAKAVKINRTTLLKISRGGKSRYKVKVIIEK